MLGLQHTEGMEQKQRRKIGAALLPEPERKERARQAAAARWGGVMSPDEARAKRAENTRRWRDNKKNKNSLALGQTLTA